MTQHSVDVTVYDGKYCFIQHEDGHCEVLRRGEPWRDPVFDNAMLALAQDLQEARDQVQTHSAQVTQLKTELQAEWEINHGDHCTNMKDCSSFGGDKWCSYPMPDGLEPANPEEDNNGN